MTDQAVPPRNLDSQSVRRIALRIRSESDYLAAAIDQDAHGDLSPLEAVHVMEDAVERLTEIIRDLRPLRRMANHAAQAAAVQSIRAALTEQRKQ